MRNLLNKFLLSMSDLSIGIYSISAMVVLSNIRVGERWNRKKLLVQVGRSVD